MFPYDPVVCVEGGISRNYVGGNCDTHNTKESKPVTSDSTSISRSMSKIAIAASVLESDVCGEYCRLTPFPASQNETIDPTRTKQVVSICHLLAYCKHFSQQSLVLLQ